MNKLAATVLALTITGSLAACGSTVTITDQDRRILKVLAASSLTEAFTALEKTYEADNPRVDVQLSFDSSAILVEQLVQGNEADVLATADLKSMAKAKEAGVTTGYVVPFATNTLTIVTPKGNPARITGIADLADATFAVCLPAAPCGDATAKLFALANFTAKATTEEENIKGVLTKVTAGEVDAGLVYVSDAKAAGAKVEIVAAQNSAEVVNVDPIVVVKGSQKARAAEDWIELVTSPDGQKVLASYGFGPAGG